MGQIGGWTHLGGGGCGSGSCRRRLLHLLEVVSKACQRVAAGGSLSVLLLIALRTRASREDMTRAEGSHTTQLRVFAPLPQDQGA